MLKMKYLFYFINWLNNAIIELNFIIIWYCFVIFGHILALFDIILITFLKKHEFRWSRPELLLHFRKRPVLDVETFSCSLGKILWRIFLRHMFFFNSVTTEQGELVDRSKVVRAQKVTESLSLGWNLLMWCIKAS